MAEVSKRTAEYELLDERGRPVFVGSLWRDQPVVLGFVRHFGCLLCHEAVSQLMAAKADIERRGAKLVIVGNGNPEHARHFAERMGATGVVYTDPSRGLYVAFGMRGGVGTTMNFTSLRNAARAFRGGHRQRTIEGDPWQQGGTAIVTPRGRIAWSYASRRAGDHVATSTLFNELDRLRATD